MNEAVRVALPAGALEQASISGPARHTTAPTSHADGGTLEADDASDDARLSVGAATLVEPRLALIEPIASADDPPREVGVLLPKKPPRV